MRLFLSLLGEYTVSEDTVFHSLYVLLLTFSLITIYALVFPVVFSAWQRWADAQSKLCF